MIGRCSAETTSVFVFQFFNLIPTLTVLENIILPQELAGKRRRDIETGPLLSCSTR